MIAAAVTLFARSGFNGVTTKEIAQSANVSDGNIFRYFPTKRDLFLCAFESELLKLSVRAEELARIAKAEDSPTALRTMLELITKTMMRQPELVRLLHFSALEFKSDVESIFERQIYPLVEALAAHEKKGYCVQGSRDIGQMTTVLFSIATVILLQDLFPAFSGNLLPFKSAESAAAKYAQLWCRVLATTPTDEELTSRCCDCSKKFTRGKKISKSE